MYLGLLLVALGGILIYRTWTFVFFLGNFPGVANRARLEERALAERSGTSGRSIGAGFQVGYLALVVQGNTRSEATLLVKNGRGRRFGLPTSES